MDGPDDAMASLQTVLSTWATQARGVLIQSSAGAQALEAETARTVRRRRTKLKALQDALAAAEDSDRQRLATMVVRTEEAVRRGEQAARLATEAHATARATEREFASVIDGDIPAAVSDLSARQGALTQYRAAGTGTSEASGAASASAGGSVFLQSHGMTSVAVEEMDFDDNPVIDGFHKGGTTATDYRWAVSTWDEVVAPGVRDGATREDFERRDAERSAPDLRRTAIVYDLFLGSDRIRLSRRADGTLNVISGRHRIEAARSLGVNSLPAEIK